MLNFLWKKEKRNWCGSSCRIQHILGNCFWTEKRQYSKRFYFRALWNGPYVCSIWHMSQTNGMNTTVDGGPVFSILPIARYFDFPVYRGGEREWNPPIVHTLARVRREGGRHAAYEAWNTRVMFKHGDVQLTVCFLKQNSKGAYHTTDSSSFDRNVFHKSPSHIQCVHEHYSRTNSRLTIQILFADMF